MLGIVMLVRPLQLLNVPYPIVVRPTGNVILVSLEQLKNALSPIDVTLSGMVMLANVEQSKNAPFPIEVTGNPLYVLGMTKGPLAVVRQSDTLYSVPRKSRVKVRSSTVAACKDATSNGNMSRLLNFIPRANEILTLRSTRKSMLRNSKGLK